MTVEAPIRHAHSLWLEDLRSRCDAGQASACAELTSGIGRGR